MLQALGPISPIKKHDESERNRVLYRYISFLIIVILLVWRIIWRPAAHYADIESDDIVNNLILQRVNSSCIPNNTCENCDYERVVCANEPFYTPENWEKLLNPDKLRLGGEYFPFKCRPLVSTAILVPYRNRPQQLQIFKTYLHNFLQHQNIHYRIFIIEQANDKAFNRGQLLNIGAHIAMQQNFSCLVLHDVDMLPERLGNLYACMKFPRHMGSAINKNRYNLPYYKYFGAVASIDSETYKNVNGFSNSFAGWGGEDDDFSNRLAYHGYVIARLPIYWSQYRMLPHKQEKLNPERKHMVKSGLARYKIDGYANLRYRLKKW